MKKFFSILALSTFVMASTTLSAEAGTSLKKGETLIEFGSSLNSTVSTKVGDVGGKSGFKSAITYAIEDGIAIQYRKNMFTSKQGTFGPMSTHANADLADYNILYRLNKHNSLILGYETNKVTYDDYISKANRSSWHIGLNTVYPLNEQTAIFTNLIFGKKVSSKEIGVNFDLNDRSLLAISYIDRRVNDMEVSPRDSVPSFGQDLINAIGNTDYKMTGIAIMYGYKF